MPRKPMKIAMPEYTPELEYTLDLGAESDLSTPLPDQESTSILGDNTTPTQRDDVSPVLPRRRSWRSSSQDQEKTRHSGAYDAAGHLKIAARARREAQKDCGICEEVASPPVRTLCCGALFCRAHIDDWLTAPAATGLCPACAAPCAVPAAPSKDGTRTPPSSRAESPSGSRSSSRLTSESGVTTQTDATSTSGMVIDELSLDPSAPASEPKALNGIQVEDGPRLLVLPPGKHRPRTRDSLLVRALSVVALLLALVVFVRRNSGGGAAGDEEVLFTEGLANEGI
ncbi:hypothetical protein C8R43DRAFT_1037623 [Mycena crocata]|nr:hypothetical protein C8R43DRAFT_1037623 [Mycena crocata]